MSSFTFTYDSEIDKVRVESDSRDILTSLISVFTVANPSYFFMQSKGCRFVDEHLSAISSLGAFSVGLFPVVYKAALKIVNGDKRRIHISDRDKDAIVGKCMPLKNVFHEDYEIGDIDEKRPLRWYQKDCVGSFLKYGRGVCVVPTGGGKSVIIGTLINELRKNGFPKMHNRKTILLVVPTRQLVDQMYSDLTEYGLTDICKFTSNSGTKRDGTFQDNSCKNGFANVIISNHAWINEKHKNEDFPLSSIGCIIADEVHTVSRGSKILKLVERIDAPLRFGFTGTLPDFIFDRWVVFGSFGIPVFTTEITKLQNEDFLSKLDIYQIHGVLEDVEKNRKLPFHVHHTTHVGDVLDDGTVVDLGTAYSMELEYIEKNSSRIFPSIFSKIEEDFDFKTKNMVVIFDRITIGQTLKEELEKKYKGVSNVLYIDGNVDISLREDIRKKLEESSGNILVAQTVTASVGLNIKNLHGIVFAFSGRSYVRIIQSIGRVIRLKNDKTTAKLFEIWYNMRYSQQHHNEKIDILTSTYGEDCIKAPKFIRIH